MNLKTLFLMSIMSFTSMLLSSDSRSEENSIQMAKKGLVNELKKTKMGQAVSGLVYEQPEEVKQLSVKAGVLAMFSKTKEYIAGAPSLAPTVTVEKNRWKAFVSVMPGFASRGDSMAFVGFRTTW